MKFKLFICGIFLFMGIYAEQEIEKPTTLQQLAARKHPYVVTAYDDIINPTKPIIIKAFATWCPYCTTMKPIFEQLEKEFGQKYIFVEIDIDQAPALAKQLNIKSLPTFIFIKNNQELGREMGAMSQNNFKKIIIKYFE